MNVLVLWTGLLVLLTAAAGRPARGAPMSDGLAELSVEDAAGVVSVAVGGRLRPPEEGLWSIAMDWSDGWPAAWYHADPTTSTQVGEWIVLTGHIDTPEGRWEITESLRPEGGWIRCVRRFVWRGEAEAGRCTLSVRWVAPGHGPRVLMPGILYHGNPSGARSGRVPVYGGARGEEALYEEHRFPMPFVSFEWPSAEGWAAAALHSLPSPAPFAHRQDQWWSMGCVATDEGTELVLLSGPCASNGVRSSIKERQGEFRPYEDAWLSVPPSGIVEKTYFLQAYPVEREGSGFQPATEASLALFRPFRLDDLPSFADILRSKARFAQTRWREAGERAGFRKYPDEPGLGPFFVLGWCGQAAAPGYALQVLGERLEYQGLDETVQRSLDTLSEAAFYDEGFHTWLNYETGEWSGVEPLSQGQAMNNFAGAVRLGRQRGMDTSRWETFLRRACDLHARRISAAEWSPKSTDEAFLIAPLAKSAELLGEPSHLQAARKAADVYAARHLSMAEPYWGGTLDASCEDKEGAYAALQGFLAVYEATGEAAYLSMAEHALDVVLTYVCVWDIDLPAGRLRDHGFRTRGWTAVSVQNMHIDVYGVLIAADVYRMGQLLSRPDLRDLALVMFRSCGQLIDAWGSQGEQPQHTNYIQGGHVPPGASLRGGYNETWTVFWITAHFLNGAAQLQEMGVDLWE